MGRWRQGCVHRPLIWLRMCHSMRTANLFQIIRDGIAGTAMAPFGGQMTEEEIWHTINYLKTLE